MMKNLTQKIFTFVACVYLSLHGIIVFKTKMPELRFQFINVIGAIPQLLICLTEILLSFYVLILLFGGRTKTVKKFCRSICYIMIPIAIGIAAFDIYFINNRIIFNRHAYPLVSLFYVDFKLPERIFEVLFAFAILLFIINVFRPFKINRKIILAILFVFFLAKFFASFSQILLLRYADEFVTVFILQNAITFWVVYSGFENLETTNQ